MTELLNSWIHGVVHLGASASLFLAVGLLTIFASRRMLPATRHLYGSFVCVGLLLLPCAISVSPTWRLGLLQIGEVGLDTSYAATPPNASNEGRLSRGATAEMSATVDVRPVDSVTASVSVPTPDEPMGMPVAQRSPKLSRHSMLLKLGLICGSVYLVGFLYCLVRLGADHMYAWRLRRSAIRWQPDNAVAGAMTVQEANLDIRTDTGNAISVPMVVGILRPTILLPAHSASWSKGKLKSAVAHELAHIERRDTSLQLIASLVKCVYWIHPFVYVLVSQMRKDRELACDERAVSRCQSRAVYARHLLEIAMAANDRNRTVVAAMTMAHKSDLESRIRSILSTNTVRLRTPRSAIATVLTFLAVSFCGVAAMSPFKFNPVSKVAAQEIAPTNPRPSSQDDRDGSADEKESNTLHASGTVVDERGVPQPNVVVISTPFEWDTQPIDQGTTGESGKFSLNFSMPARTSSMLHTWFFSEGHSVRVAAMWGRFRNGKRVVDNIEIPLPAYQETPFRILRPNGMPCRGALLSPLSVEIPNGVFMANESTGLSTSPPDKLLEYLSSVADGQGIAVIRAVRSQMIYTVAVDTADFGRQLFVVEQLDGDSPRVLQLAAVGAIRGQVLLRDAERLAGTTVVIGTDGDDNNRTPRGIATVELDDQGRFEVPKIAAWPDLSLEFSWSDTIKVQPVLKEKLEVRAGEVLSVEIKTVPTVTVTGVVVIADTLRPVQGARISFRHPDALLGGGVATTNESGRYSIRVPAGEIARHLFSFGGSSHALYEYDHPRLAPFEESILLLAPLGG